MLNYPAFLPARIVLSLIDHGLRSPVKMLAVAAVSVSVFAFGISGISKDPSVDAFVPDDHPAAVAKNRAVELFGVEDPIVVGIVAPTGQSTFTPTVLNALRAIESEIRKLPNVKKGRLISVLSESALSGRDGDLYVDALLPDGEITKTGAATAFDRLQSMPMMTGLLASSTGDTVTLIVPVKNPNAAGDTYSSVLAIVNSLTPKGYAGVVTGVASMNGRLAEMVNTDTRIFIPAAVLTALLVLFVALRRTAALLGPGLVIAGSAAVAIGLMGWLDARYYLITTALPVIIMAIAIADSLHITLMYLRERELHQDLTSAEAVHRALSHTFLPVSLTTLTTVCGFAGLALGSPMQPISEFGWFAAVGVIAAWWLSLTLLPAILVITDLSPKVMTTARTIATNTRLDEWIIRLTHQSFVHPRLYTVGMALTLAVFTYFAASASFDYERQRYFQEDDPVRLADVMLNERLAGLNFLDVVVSSPQPDGLLTPEAMNSMAELAKELKAEPLVAKVSGIHDYMSLMHGALTDAPKGSLPTKENAPAQYMLLYEASGDPEDFVEEIDYDYQNALLRTQLTTDRYSKTQEVVRQFERLAREYSMEGGLQVSVSGRVAVNSGWMHLLSTSHFQSLGIALALVFLASLATFRNLGTALLTLIPVLTGVLFTYAAMGFFEIDIAPATSMTAAIATGLGVDFAIHLLAELRRAERAGARGINLFQGRYTLVARACIYSALALGFALAIICLSSAPPLKWFGALVSAAAVGSLAGAVLIIPASFTLFQSRAAERAPRLEAQTL